MAKTRSSGGGSKLKKKTPASSRMTGAWNPSMETPF